MSRAEAEEQLAGEEVGVFLVRNSSSSAGDVVLCVREEERVSHYIIQKVAASDAGGGGGHRFRIGDQTFPDLPSLLHYYRHTLLDSTHLRRPLACVCRVTAAYDFAGRDADDLPFAKVPPPPLSLSVPGSPAHA